MARIAMFIAGIEKIAAQIDPLQFGTAVGGGLVEPVGATLVTGCRIHIIAIDGTAVKGTAVA